MDIEFLKYRLENAIFHYYNKIALLGSLEEAIMVSSYTEAMRARIIHDGHYHVPTDIDVTLMYCMGCEL